MADRFPSEIVNDVAHRPWGLPSGSWVLSQSWHDVLFLHWPMAPDALRSTVPAPFALDLYDGQAWLGVVPFEMTNVAPRLAPAVPGLSAFRELNVRTYVTAGGKAGVYFFSLDAESRVAVKLARTMLRLPYFEASMDTVREAGWVDYWCERHATDEGRPAEFEARYRPTGVASPAAPGTLEHFLVERYCLYNVDHAGRPYRLEIHHPAWPLQEAEGTIVLNSMAAAVGLHLPPEPPLMHYARRQDVVVWMPERF